MLDEGEEVSELAFGSVAVLVAGECVGDIGSSGDDVVVNRKIGIEFKLLGKIPNAESASGGQFAGVGLVLS